MDNFVHWKKSWKTGFANPTRIGDNSITFSISVFDKNQENYVTKTSDYISFLIFSKTECGKELIKGLDEDDVIVEMLQKGTAVYKNYGHKHLKWTKGKNKSFTMQLSRELNGEEDTFAQTKKDKAYVTISNLSNEVMDIARNDSFLDNCLNKVQVGVLIPTVDIQHDFNHARCVGEQKLVGFGKQK